MRNINKIKELKDDKYTFSLDNKQIASIILSSIALGTILFLIGFFVGQNKYKKQYTQVAQEKKNVAIIKTVSIQEKQTVKEESKKIEKEKTEKISADSKEDQTKNNEAKNLENKKENSKESTKEESKVNDTLKQENSKEKLDKTKPLDIPKLAFKKVDKTAKNNQGSGGNPFKTSLSSESKGNFVLQVLATPKLKEAKELKKRLSESGYNVFIEQTESNKITYNRVRIGYFADKEAARTFKSNFEKESGMKKTFVTNK